MAALTIANPEPSTTRLERGLGIVLIAAVWLYCGYLILCHGAPLLFEPRQLNAWLGDELYNGLIASGGLLKLWAVGFDVLVWQVPLAVGAVMAWWGSRLVLPEINGAARCVLAGALSVALLAGIHTQSQDGWPGCLATTYASGYSHEDFARVEIGMSRAEVIDLLGEPLFVWNHETNPGLSSFPGGVFYGIEGHELGFWSASFIAGLEKHRSIRFKHEVVYEKFGEDSFWSSGSALAR